jgi:hypothetical protein
MILQILQILVKDIEIGQSKAKLDELASSVEQTADRRKGNLNEIKKHEGEIRKLDNEIED